MVSRWSLSDSKSPQVSKTLLTILANRHNLVVWMVSTRPIISKSSNPCTNIFVSVSRVTIIAMFRYLLSLITFFFKFTLWSARTAMSTIWRLILFLLLLLTIPRYVCLAETRWSVCISNHWEVSSFHSLGRILGCIITICSYGQI